MLSYLIPDGYTLQQAAPNLHQPVSGDSEAQPGWVSTGTGVGYGGALDIALAVNEQGTITRLAILSSKETSSYLKKITDAKLPQSVVGDNIKKTIQIDGISGATLTSNALEQGINQAADPVREKTLGYTLTEKDNPLTHFTWLDIAAALMFAAAVWVSRTRHPRKKAMNWGVMLVSMGLFGFYSVALFSSSTMGIFMSGSWLSGLGNYTALILLVLTVFYLLVFNKNVYCESICPFGTTQQCLGKITNAKAVTLKHAFFIWFPRALLLATLCFGIYFRNPAGFSYEPFGIMFSMIGSMYLFVLTFMIVLTSLVAHRPWCKTLCPVNAMGDFIKFNKNWVKQVQKDRQRAAKKKQKAAGNTIPHRSVSS